MSSVLHVQKTCAFPSKTYTRLRVFFIGPRGAGKSATINTIIGRDVAESTSSLRKESTTKKMNKYLDENQNVVLVDTPALQKSVIKELKKEFRKSDILAFVIAAQRLQMEDETCILMVLKDLEYLHSRSFILLTRGSNIVDDSNVFNPESNKELYRLYEAVDKRYVVFENRNKTEKERKLCIDKFLSMSREISFNEEIKIETLRDNDSKVDKIYVVFENRNKTEKEKLCIYKFLAMSSEISFNEEIKIETLRDNDSKVSRDNDSKVSRDNDSNASRRNIIIQSIKWTVITLPIFPIFISAKNVLISVATNALHTMWCCNLSPLYLDFQSITSNSFQNF
ncbi:GTPase IMAP family member 7 isoform X3 [Magallana gigas]|uniref:GTPase IMAP family member 7 isoform X3 n=1 Tax=Magallana gigas TaxID=29159 RepID=UPI00333F08EA